jgi:hypothetical protein
MSSHLFKFSYAKPDREKEEKAEKKRVEKADKERVEKSKLAKDKNEYIETWRQGKIVEKEELEQKKVVTHSKNIADAIWEAWTLGDNERKEIFKDSEIKLNTDIKNKYQGIYKDIKNKFPDIDIDFYIMCLRRNRTLHNIIDLQTINYNKYIAYKLLELINDYEGKTGLRISFNENSENINIANIFSEISKSYRPRNNMITNPHYILVDQQRLIERQQQQRQQQTQVHQSELLIKIPIDAILDRFNNSKAFIKELDAKIFMDNVNIQWTILQNAIKNNLFKASPKPSPKPSPKASAKSSSPKASPKASAKSSSPKTSPKASPKTSPKTSPKPSPKASAKSSSPKASPKASPKTSSPKASAKSSSPKASPINRDDMAELSMEELFAKLAKNNT